MRCIALALLAALAAVPVTAGTALAQQGGPTAQQDRMRSCNAEASGKSLAGEARQRFMSDCLSNTAAAPAAPDRTAQQERMRTCQAEATSRTLSGEPRQRFVDACLAGSAATGTTATGRSATGSAPLPGTVGDGRFESEAQAKRACGGATVVWANPDSQVFHAAGSQFYGKTRDGGYMCRPAAEKAGYRQASGSRG